MLRENPDELSIIKEFIEVIGQPKQIYSKIGDDVAHIPSGKGRVVVKCDMLVGETDVPQGMTYREAARKALASVVSDFAAKGVKPNAALVSLGIPPTLTIADIRELALGVRDAREEFKFEFLGGDTNQAKDLIIDCILLGYAKHIIGRAGAKVGDIVAVTGDFGYTGAGLYALSKYGRVAEGFAEKAISTVLKPKPPLELGLMLAERRLMSSSIDSSDGLALSLYTLSEASNVKIVVFDLPAPEGLREFAEENGLSLEELVFYSGEEYEIVFTAHEDKLDKIKRLAESLGKPIKAIGRVEQGKPVVEYVTLGKKKILERRGWIHLSAKRNKNKV